MSFRSQFNFHATTVVLDLDGACDTSVSGEVFQPALHMFARWLDRGAKLVFATNQTTEWVCEQVVEPMFAMLSRRPDGSVFMACEHGAILSRVEIPPSPSRELSLQLIQAFPTPWHEEIRRCLEDAQEFGQVKGCFRRGARYQVCFEFSQPFEFDPLRLFPEWMAGRIRKQVRVLKTRDTLTFLGADVGKERAIDLLLNRIRASVTEPMRERCDEAAATEDAIDADRFRRGASVQPAFCRIGFDDPALFAKRGAQGGNLTNSSPRGR